MSTSLYVPVLCQPPEVLYVDGLPGGEGLSGAQVHDLQLVLLVHQHVVRLQVQVHHPAAVQVVHRAQDLDQQLGHVFLRVQVSAKGGPSFVAY